jgi:hypothetical protein
MATPSITIQPALGAVAIFDALGYKHATQDEDSNARMMAHLEYLANQGTSGLFVLERLSKAIPNVLEMRGLFDLVVPLDGSLKLRLARFSDTYQIAAWHEVKQPELSLCLQAVLGGLVTMLLFSVTEEPHVLFRGAVEIGPLMIGPNQVDGVAYRDAVTEFEQQAAGIVHLCERAANLVSERGFHAAGAFPSSLFRVNVPFEGGERETYIVNPVGCASLDARTDFMGNLEKAFHVPAGEDPSDRVSVLIENSKRLYEQCEQGTPLPPREDETS